MNKDYEIRKDTPTMGDCASRMNAKSVIMDKAKRLRREADALECIAESISWSTIKPEVEELLWNYFVSAGH